LKKQTQFSVGGIDVSIYIKYSYGEFCAFFYSKKTNPNKANLFSPQTCAGGLKPNLKKQSQLSVAHISAKSLEKGDYDNNSPAGDKENKANRSQFYSHRRFSGPVRGEIATGHFGPCNNEIKN